METQQDRSLKKLISNRGGEFLNSHFKQLSNECGFIHTFSPAYTLEHNGFAERANQTMLEKARCMLNASKLSNSYWAEADNNSCPLNITWDAIEGQEVVDEFNFPLECSVEPGSQEPVDEVQMTGIQDTMPTSEPDWVDEVLPAGEIASLPPVDVQTQPPICIKVVGPHHPTLIYSNIDQQNILSYSRKAGALLTAVDETP
ncbi:hypothetical protein O181_070888 [Austropuccinia psidii MF-1]|uniref:Integrase catalytic domain-containing protein n=1 Tax=Austropuccinia psidii MF-1 TaxID=1389203 RepID=A0A9Q3I7P6_9BASI|nr:hypothetical protein [Austropuccinia psidii MF-1]